MLPKKEAGCHSVCNRKVTLVQLTSLIIQSKSSQVGRKKGKYYVGSETLPTSIKGKGPPRAFLALNA